MTDAVDVVVLGAGVVGLAVARAFALAGREVVVLEKNVAIGEEASSRSSEVIHAGLYYRPGGLRARLCAPGNRMLYDFCAVHHIDHERCGKLIVAHGPAETARLKDLKALSEQNGVSDLEVLTGEEARALEPALQCDAALLSPSTGIIDSHGLMMALLGDLEDAGGVLALKTPFESAVVEGAMMTMMAGGAEPMTLSARLVVNSTGLWSDRVARRIDGLPLNTVPRIYYGKGQYFTYSGAPPFDRLIYPVPGADSLGAHYTRDLGGQARIGPDLAFVASNTDYDVDQSHKDWFYEGARRFWPDLDPGRLQPGYAGIRAKSAGPGLEGDFHIQGRETHGLPQYVGLYGMESPALTSCLAIAEHVVKIAG